ncbi:MAG: hypothetical protein NZ585_09485 [Chloracidobacterium sp.]|nr:hypothetical protein [Chloracidobacterium sp.]MDW8216989.1 hypothetical protein [Acidobacteriota bacterium]
MAFKKEPSPQVVVVAAPPSGAAGHPLPGQTPTPKAEYPYRAAFPAPATVAEPPSVTEHTTERLNDPYQRPPRVS